MADLEYLCLSKPMRVLYKIKNFFKNLGKNIGGFFKALPSKLANFFKKISGVFIYLYEAFAYGGWKTRLSFLFFGMGNLLNGQILRGFIYFIYEVAFIFFMISFGGPYLSKFGTLGTKEMGETESGFKIIGDNSFNILLYSVLTILIIICTLYVWYQSIKQAYETKQLVDINKRLSTGKEDIKNLGNKYYHVTLLGVPMLGLVMFTIVPLIFMIFVSFTNYNTTHLPPEKLFTWVGFDNFKTMLTGNGIGGSSDRFAYTFKTILLWTILWAILATFSNFFLGMLVAIFINRKGIKLKKLWRTVLVTTIAVPQFISLLLMSKMLQKDGIYNILLSSIGLSRIDFLGNATNAKIAVVLVNLWVGIPYTVLSCTGILMNIPDDLYEAAKIDGANPYRMFMNITLPYMMFVMTPSLITTFIGNLNNFNIIYLLTGGGPKLDMNMTSTAGQTDLLITWLYTLTVNDQSYEMASVIGILVFIICAVLSLIFYSRSGSVKNEEDFQ